MLLQLAKMPEFWLTFVPFVILVAVFNSFASILNQALVPYGITDNEAGIAGAIIIIAGIVAAGITSLIIDRTSAHLVALKIGIPLLAISYICFIWAPSRGEVIGSDINCGFIGAISFAILPVALEFVADITYPVSVEFSSTLLWTGGQLLGSILLICAGYLKAGPDSEVPGNMNKALILHAVLAASTIPLTLALGMFGRQQAVLTRRMNT
jgi:MFS transporter, FLVCR family, MFS-domain-containing protein 7